MSLSPADARPVRAAASALRHTPKERRTGHLAEKLERIADRIEAPVLSAGADRVYLGIHAPTKAAICTELRRLGLAGEDLEEEYARLQVIDRVLDQLGLQVCPGPEAVVVYEDGRGLAELEERYSHMDLGEG